MAVQPRLVRFDVEPSGRDVVIRIEDDRGAVIHLLASRDQLDLMADVIDDALLSDEAPDDEGNGVRLG